MRRSVLPLLAVAWLGGCSTPARVALPPLAPEQALSAPAVLDAPWRLADRAEPVPETHSPVLITGGRLLIGDGAEIARGFVLLVDGRIQAVGEGDGPPPAAGTRVIDARGKTVTPGLIDTHSHLGVYPTPSADAHLDGNEMTTPLTPGVRVIDAFWPQDPGIERALHGGVTTIQALPGSGNLIGGRAITLKLRHATNPRNMHFANAPDGLKMACGENPKRVYGERKTKPMTRMGNLALQRAAFLAAKELIVQWDHWRSKEADRLTAQQRKAADLARQQQERAEQRLACQTQRASAEICNDWVKQWRDKPLAPLSPSQPATPPKRDLDLETLAGALEGRVLVHIHCYRADDMSAMLALADEMGFSVRSFHHALEAYKIRAELARRKVAVSTWSDWWGFKLEAYDGIMENLALVDQAGGMAIVHSDSREGIRRLNQEAAKGMFAGIAAGMTLSEAKAIRWVTMNPAWALGISDQVGSLSAGKQADVVIWDRTPFSVYASAERVFIDGVERFDKSRPAKPWSDFEAAP